MKAEHWAFIWCFAVTSTVALSSGGCSTGDECAPVQSLPDAQEPFDNVEFSSYDEGGNSAALGFEVDQATLELTGGTVVIEYEGGGQSHRVVYDVQAN